MIFSMVMIILHFMNGSDLDSAKAISGAVNFIVAPDKEDEKMTFPKEALCLNRHFLFVHPMVQESAT